VLLTVFMKEEGGVVALTRKKGKSSEGSVQRKRRSHAKKSYRKFGGARRHLSQKGGKKREHSRKAGLTKKKFFLHQGYGGLHRGKRREVVIKKVFTGRKGRRDYLYNQGLLRGGEERRKEGLRKGPARLKGSLRNGTAVPTWPTEC